MRYKRDVMLNIGLIDSAGLLALVGFGFAWSHLMSRRPKGAPDLNAYDNPSYKVEMTTINNNDRPLITNGHSVHSGHHTSNIGSHSYSVRLQLVYTFFIHNLEKKRSDIQ